MILVKLPTRQRPRQAVEALNACIEMQSTNNVHYLLTVDEDDRSMDSVIKAVSDLDFITVDIGTSKSKIHAVNRGVDAFSEFNEWDLLVLLSDDMICQQKGWDAQLIDEMREHYPDSDGVLFHNDGYVGSALNTMCILGRKYYERFNYIYNPNYVSFWCDNEFMEVAGKLNKQTYFSDVLFKHEHPANNGSQSDSLYLKNNNNYKRDQQTFKHRKKNNFDLSIAVNTHSNG